MPPSKKGADPAPDEQWTVEGNEAAMEAAAQRWPPQFSSVKGLGREVLALYKAACSLLGIVPLPCLSASLEAAAETDTLSVFSHEIDRASSKTLGYCLAECGDVTTLVLSDVRLRDTEIFSFCRRNPRIQRIIFRFQKFTREMLQAVLEAIEYSPYLRELRFLRCSFESLHPLWEYLQSYRSVGLSSLGLASCGLQNEDLDSLAASLCLGMDDLRVLSQGELQDALDHTNYSLRALDLNGNDLAPEAVLSFSTKIFSLLRPDETYVHAFTRRLLKQYAIQTALGMFSGVQADALGGQIDILGSRPDPLAQSLPLLPKEQSEELETSLSDVVSVLSLAASGGNGCSVDAGSSASAAKGKAKQEAAPAVWDAASFENAVASASFCGLSEHALAIALATLSPPEAMPLLEGRETMYANARVTCLSLPSGTAECIRPLVRGTGLCALREGEWEELEENAARLELCEAAYALEAPAQPKKK